MIDDKEVLIDSSEPVETANANPSSTNVPDQKSEILFGASTYHSQIRDACRGLAARKGQDSCFCVSCHSCGYHTKSELVSACNGVDCIHEKALCSRHYAFYDVYGEVSCVLVDGEDIYA